MLLSAGFKSGNLAIFAPNYPFVACILLFRDFYGHCCYWLYP
jgi:hypothetical protein